MDPKLHTIYLAGGCFWGTQHFMSSIPGVMATRVGYANSQVPDPTYEDVCRGDTGAAEAVETLYDASVLSLPRLLDLFMASIDPTSVNRQGNDFGAQYRSGIYYTDPSDRPVIEDFIGRVAGAYGNSIAVQVMPLENFYEAESFHQDYLVFKPDGYCHIEPGLIDVVRKITPGRDISRVFVAPDDARLREVLTPMQYDVTRRGATEPPFANVYFDNFTPGIYVDIASGEPLFASGDKFDAGCGWPSFTRPVDPSAIAEVDDHTHGMERVEVRSRSGRSHLGHVFDDGPAESGGRRYCINSAALRFIPLRDMAEEGYAAYIPAVIASHRRQELR